MEIIREPEIVEVELFGIKIGDIFGCCAFGGNGGNSQKQAE